MVQFQARAINYAACHSCIILCISILGLRSTLALAATNAFIFNWRARYIVSYADLTFITIYGIEQAQLLAKDVDNSGTIRSPDGGSTRTRDAELRKMLTDVLIDNAKLRKQVNSVTLCTVQDEKRASRQL